MEWDNKFRSAGIYHTEDYKFKIMKSCTGIYYMFERKDGEYKRICDKNGLPICNIRLKYAKAYIERTYYGSEEK